MINLIVSQWIFSHVLHFAGVFLLVKNYYYLGAYVLSRVNEIYGHQAFYR
jgi:hypothetical protein